MNIKGSSAVTMIGSGGAVIFGMTANELAALGGLVIAAIGLIMNQYWQWRAYKLKERQCASDDE